jgi:membrane protease YdiL (CAAX protease family)
MNTRTRLVWVAALTLVASLLADVVLIETVGSRPAWWLPGKAALLLALAAAALVVARDRVIAAYGLVLAVLMAVQAFERQVSASAWWSDRFPTDAFVTQFGGSILLKVIAVVPVAVVLLLVTRSPRAAYLTPGDLRVKAERIGWLGIPGNTIAWGRLALISGLLIAFGTLLLTLLTVTGFALPGNLDRLVPLLPLIVLLALGNSFAEGVVYRSAVLGPLTGELPKGAVVLASAAFFGMAHYYGAPSGPIGVVMSGVLGWYMARAMFETRGFLAPWIIHFLQDVVIFSAIVLLGGF